MNVSGSAPIESGGISVRIVDLLEKYRSAIPIDFLAKELGRRSEPLLDDLLRLQSMGVVEIDQTHRTAALVRREGTKFGLAKFFQTLSGVK